MELTTLAILFFIILTGAGLMALTYRTQKGGAVKLRPHPGYLTLQKQVGQAVESGQPIHISLGRGSLSGRANPTSVAALTILNHLAEGSCANGMPPTVTTGDGTLLLAGQDQLRQVYHQAHRPAEYQPGMVQFQASSSDPITYAAGTSQVVNQQAWGGNILIGQFGQEIPLIIEAGSRAQAEQIISTDDPVALALAYPSAHALIIGEEHLAAGAYLNGQPAQLASLQLQDILRLLIIIAILLATLMGLLVSL